MCRAVRLNAVVAVVACLTVFGCSSAISKPLPPSSTPVVVRMVEYRFQYDARDIHPGRNTIRVQNIGKFSHNLTLFIVPDDAPTIEAQQRANDFGEARETALVFTQTPGNAGVFAVDFRPETRYAFLCRFRDPDGGFHYNKGMLSEFRTP